MRKVIKSYEYIHNKVRYKFDFVITISTVVTVICRLMDYINYNKLFFIDMIYFNMLVGESNF